MKRSKRSGCAARAAAANTHPAPTPGTPPRVKRDKERLARAASKRRQRIAIEVACQQMMCALRDVLAHRHTDRYGCHVCWIGEETFERVEAALQFAEANGL